MRTELHTQREVKAMYDYLPTKYAASSKDWTNRKFIWNFKDGKQPFQYAKRVAKVLYDRYGDNCKKIVFACIPSHTAELTELRYKEFSEAVCEITGMQNAYNYINVVGSRLAIHESKAAKVIEPVQVIEMDADFFSGKYVLVFDDIITTGKSFENFAQYIETMGAKVIGGLFLAKSTIKE